MIKHYLRRVAMNPSSKNYRCLHILLFLLSLNISAEYIEGVDTTDINGYGLDSAFQVGTEGQISCKNGLFYCLIGGAWGLFNYSFNDLKIASTTGYNSFTNIAKSDEMDFTCFVVKKDGSTYSKVQVMEKLSDNRHVFKYGSNTTPLDRHLVKPDYDQSIRFKPNNATYHYNVNVDGNPPPPRIPDSLFWEPPLPNDNHLIGYILYQSKFGVAIDTTKPIDTAQWDSIAFTDSTLLINKLIDQRYVNLVAVYKEGKSAFLQGWTFNEPKDVSIQKKSAGSITWKEGINIKKATGGFSILLQPMFKNAVLSIYNVSGKRIANLPYTSSRTFWNATQQNVPIGLYLLRAEFPDRSVITKPFAITR
jgi:hypothetical protein